MQDRDGERVVVLELLERVAQLGRHRAVDGVAPLGPVEGDRADVLVDVEPNGFHDVHSTRRGQRLRTRPGAGQGSEDAARHRTGGEVEAREPGRDAAECVGVARVVGRSDAATSISAIGPRTAAPAAIANARGVGSHQAQTATAMAPQSTTETVAGWSRSVAVSA